MSNEIEWADPSRKGEKVETQDQTAERIGVDVKTLHSYARIYPDRFPVVIAYLLPTRKRLRSVKELEEFFQWKAAKPKLRASEDVLSGKVARLERAVERAEKRKKRAEEELETSKQSLSRLRAELRTNSDYLKLLSADESDV